MNAIKSFLSIAILLLLGFLQPDQVTAQQPVFPNSTELGTYIDSLFQKTNETTPGAAVAVIHEGKMLFTGAYGSANLEYEIPNTSSTIFHVASIAKQFTAFSILLLQEKGLLSLDDDIRQYLPEVPDFGHTITLRHLATHTSGLRDQWNLLLLAGVRPDDVITNEHVLALVSQQKELNFIPGEEYLYCNTGYSLLAEVVARASGQTFAEFTQENLFNPLGMDNTSFNDDHERIIKNRAYSYYSRDGESYHKRVLSYGNVGPTNLLTTVEDLGRWLVNFENPTVESSAIIAQMTTEAKLNNGEGFGGGLGIFIHSNQGITELEHGGADAGFRAQLSMFPTQRLGVIVVSNDARCNAQKMVSQIADYCLSKVYRQTTADSDKEERTFIKLRPKSMEAFVGHYWTKEKGFKRHIYLKNDTLMHFRTENNESPLAPFGKNQFQVLNVPVDAIVRFDEIDGEIYLIEQVNDGKPTVLEKYNPIAYTDEDWLSYAGEYYSHEIKTAYHIQWNDSTLTATHLRMGSIDLKMIKHDFFSGDRGFFGNVEFIRNSKEEVVGFRVSNGRVRDLLFEKRSIELAE